MAASNQNSNTINPGSIIELEDGLYRVESSVKMTVTKGKPFIKTKLRNVTTADEIEKNFKPGQQVKEVALAERTLEYLYPDGDLYMFLDINLLDVVGVATEVVGTKELYLKEGVEVKGTFYGDVVAAVELPNFLELMIKSVDGDEEEGVANNAPRMATLETGARVEVPGFVEAGDVIKVDTKANEYIQRV
jgi:elongation factor P